MSPGTGTFNSRCQIVRDSKRQAAHVQDVNYVKATQIRAESEAVEFPVCRRTESQTLRIEKLTAFLKAVL